ncbi:MAG: adaptor protein MecA [Ruminococcaceae bacterium]|nr:adaptor protein MecA [Oscillospiraceae bacterium]
MKLQQLNENEIKITLSKEDLSELDLTLRTIDYNTTKTRKAIWEIFDRAKDQTGFDAAKNKIYIKLYPLSDGGCEMYVSKLTGKNDISFDRLPAYSASRRDLRASGTDAAFRFNDFSELYDACVSIKPHTDTALYEDKNGCFILLLKKATVSSAHLHRWEEFGNRIKTKYITAYLDEHCKKIIQSCAVQKIIGKGI